MNRPCMLEEQRCLFYSSQVDVKTFKIDRLWESLTTDVSYRQPNLHVHYRIEPIFCCCRKLFLAYSGVDFNFASKPRVSTNGTGLPAAVNPIKPYVASILYFPKTESLILSPRLNLNDLLGPFGFPRRKIVRNRDYNRK